MRRSILSLLVFLFIAAAAFAQDVKNCATMEQDAVNRVKYPKMGSLMEFEEAVRLKTQEIAARAGSGRTQAVVLTIPVVVHVVHTGEAVGSGLNLSQAQVKAQLEVLNEDFRRKTGTPGFNDNPIGADIEIEFCLSPVDENGVVLSEPGIHRVRGNNATWTREQIEGSLKPQTIWNPNLFYNIWTLKFGGEDTNLLGYAQFPDQSGLQGLNPVGGSESTDGVVIQYTSFGSVDKGNFPIMQAPYNHGRTLSHETGHWLGLRHIWGDGSCGNDFVGDTPTHHSENRGCPTSKVSCNNVSLEMPQNYMDYTDDACMNIFTVGQKARIRAVMELSPRRKILTQANLCSNLVAAKPIADFAASDTLVLRGGKMAFTDLTTNFPTTWSWAFEAGDPNTSNVQNPVVVYNTPGKFKVSLIATNALGSDTLEREEFVEVSTAGLCNSLNNFVDTVYTPSLIRMKEIGANTGYLTGHNSTKSKALSEKFTNRFSYKYISGAQIKFAKAYSKNEDASVTIYVWTARGAQTSPGTVIEQKTIPIKQIKDDIANNRPTVIRFDRETPVFGRPFHVGMEMTYGNDTLAIQSSANGEATNSTSWIQSSAGVWQAYSLAYGVNIAMDITAIVGMNPSVQVAASKLFINPGEEVVLNARGASIFVWNSSDASINQIAGPQIIVNPTATTLYETSGSGLALCDSTARTTIYVRQGQITGVNENFVSDVRVFPNPGTNELFVAFENEYRGPVHIKLKSILNQTIQVREYSKSEDRFEAGLDTSGYPPGVYITTVKIGENEFHGKWVKH